MPRSRGGPVPAPRRPAAPAPPPRAPANQQQTRPASTAAHPPTAQAGAAPTQQGSGLFGQMASTAAGVAVGSSIGHAIGGFFGGSGSSAPAAPVESQSLAASQDQGMGYQAQQQGGACVGQVANFRQCMDQQNGDLNVCGWYLDQLKACQQAASQY